VSWLSAAVEEVIRRRAERDDQVLAELRRVRADLEQIRKEAARDRFVSHVSVGGTFIALGLAWLTLPRQSQLGQLEAVVVFVGAFLFLFVVLVRRAVTGPRPRRR
jgi:hypothetical protein